MDNPNDHRPGMKSKLQVTMPAPEDAISFLREVEAGFSKRNALSSAYLIDFDPETPEKVLSHKFYEWLTSIKEFGWVIDYLSTKNLEGEFPERRK